MDEIAKRLAELAEKVGPAAMEAARGAVRVEAYSTLAGGAFAMVAAAAIFYFGRFLWLHDDDFYGSEPKFWAVISFLVALVFGLIGLWNIVDPWTWVAQSNPDLWLAKKILKL
jgi:hypothetical protein